MLTAQYETVFMPSTVFRGQPLGARGLNPLSIPHPRQIEPRISTETVTVSLTFDSKTYI